ncbi:hypothetical protein B0H17DRAFT_1338044 [Mycena rosella]|uniref:Uncharacterized protein n=1 Tax=Mycena rosella TaxID=1033263 RepID=A0AAD7CPT1_MYCRO|nr:hypothetical protein B0H17DRAFT_1338044 [Mycena rosella]
MRRTRLQLHQVYLKRTPLSNPAVNMTSTTAKARIVESNSPPPFDNYVGADALLFSGKHNIKALRLEVPELGKEFSDTQFIGTDPQGIFYYRDGYEFKSGVTVYYKVKKIPNDPQPGKQTVSIKFSHDPFTTGEKEPKLQAEFRANDLHDTVAAAGMDGYTFHGTWSNLDTVTATTVFTKFGDSQKIFVASGDLPEKATITLPDNVLDGVNYGDGVRGKLVYRKETDLTLGIQANYNSDRVVFYNNDWNATDFTAYFIPFEIDQTNLGIPSSQTQILPVAWTK